MKIKLASFHKILNGDLKPWLENIATREQFKAWASELPEQKPLEPFTFVLDFIKPFSPKTIYYEKVISNTTNEFINQIKTLFADNDSDNIKTNVIYNALQKEITPILETIASLTQDDYSSDYINKNNPVRTTPANKEISYILHLIKAKSLQLFLEIQKIGMEYLKGEYLELDDLHFQFFNEPIPDFYSITKQEIKKTQKPKPKDIEKKTYYSFKLKNYPAEQYKLTYLWESLKMNGTFISEETKLNDFKKIFSGNSILNKVVWNGNKTELAYFMKQLHNKEKLVEDVGQEIWAITIKCFEKSDGSSYDRNEFRELKKPAKADLIIRAIENLK